MDNYYRSVVPLSIGMGPIDPEIDHVIEHIGEVVEAQRHHPEQEELVEGGLGLTDAAPSSAKSAVNPKKCSRTNRSTAPRIIQSVCMSSPDDQAESGPDSAREEFKILWTDV